MKYVRRMRLAKKYDDENRQKGLFRLEKEPKLKYLLSLLRKSQYISHLKRCPVNFLH